MLCLLVFFRIVAKEFVTFLPPGARPINDFFLFSLGYSLSMFLWLLPHGYDLRKDLAQPLVKSILLPKLCLLPNPSINKKWRNLIYFQHYPLLFIPSLVDDQGCVNFGVNIDAGINGRHHALMIDLNLDNGIQYTFGSGKCMVPEAHGTWSFQALHSLHTEPYAHPNEQNKLRFGRIEDPRSGHWNFNNKAVIEVEEMKSWTLVNYCPRLSSTKVQILANGKLVDSMVCLNSDAGYNHLRREAVTFVCQALDKGHGKMRHGYGINIEGGKDDNESEDLLADFIDEDRQLPSCVSDSALTKTMSSENWKHEEIQGVIGSSVSILRWMDKIEDTEDWTPLQAEGTSSIWSRFVDIEVESVTSRSTSLLDPLPQSNSPTMVPMVRDPMKGIMVKLKTQFYGTLSQKRPQIGIEHCPETPRRSLFQYVVRK
eukprot:Gb_16599 [translate_table: standard]